MRASSAARARRKWLGAGEAIVAGLAEAARPIDYSALLIESSDPTQCPGQLMIPHPESDPTG